MSRKRKNLTSRAIVLLLGIGAMGLVALGAYVKLAPADRVPPAIHRQDDDQPTAPLRHRTHRSSGETEEPVASDKVLVPVIDGDKVRLTTKRASGEPMLYVAEHTLRAMKISDAHIKSVSVAGGLARVEIEGDLPLSIGSDQEGTLLKAMQMGLGQFPDVEQIQFVSGGQPIESLGGHVESSDPMPVLRPGQSGDPTPSSSSDQP